jgi:ABC-type multidrug transport system fused ATPase/permease subunit
MSVRDAIGRSLGLLSRRDRRLLLLVIFIQVATSALDLLAVLLIGLVGAIFVTAIQSAPPPAAVQSLAETLGLSDLTSQELVAVLSGAAAAALITKSTLSAYLSRRAMLFLANRQALIASRLSKELLSRPLLFVQLRTSQETSYALINGATAATLSILGQFTVVISELALLIVLAVGLMFLNPWVTLGSICFFAVVALGMHRALGSWASRVGRQAAGADVESLSVVQEALSTYREITVSDRRSQYVTRIQELRWTAARATADIQFLAQFPKYVFEGALVVGGFLLAAVLFATQSAVEAMGTLALFIAASTRVMPSLLRLQVAFLSMRNGAAMASRTFALSEDLGHPQDAPTQGELGQTIRLRVRQGNPDFIPSVRLREVSVWYPGAVNPALTGVNLDLATGQSLALVGRSGAGKSTLADVILGVLEPDEGTALVNMISPSQASSRWPGSMAYVPQEVVLATDTIRSNVALGLPRDAIDDEMVWEALQKAFLAEFFEESPNGLDTVVGERGSRLSGGQRQRVGLARALYTRPRLLVLDEATSALDAETEDAIARMLRELEGEVTTVVVAHRLSTVRHADIVMYLDKGSVVSAGTFEHVRGAVPALERQAQLMGLES